MVVSLSFESVAVPSRVKARDMPYGASSPGRIVGGMRCRRYECIRKYKRQRLWILAFARMTEKGLPDPEIFEKLALACFFRRARSL